MDNHRLKIKPKKNTLDYIIEYAGWMLLVILWIFTIYQYPMLPETIPTHYNLAGEPDAFGPKIHLWILPIIGSLIYIGLNILNRYPHQFSYPVEITKENARKQYTIGTRSIRYLNTLTLFIFAYIVYADIQNALEHTAGLGNWFTPVMISSLILLTIATITLSIRNQ